MGITFERQGQRVYLVGDTYTIRDRIKAIGGHWDGDRRAWWVVAAKETAARQLVESLSGASSADAPKAKQDPSDIRLTGKGEYKGRTYYMGAQTRDGQRVRLLTLPDAQGNFLDFWADCAAVRVVKAYQPRQHTYRGRTTTEYTTLGGIARFIAREQRNRAEGGAVCAECGKSGDLVRDLEDGMMKHRRCCDIEP